MGAGAKGGAANATVREGRAEEGRAGCAGAVANHHARQAMLMVNSIGKRRSHADIWAHEVNIVQVEFVKNSI